jgi:hypothetical protein
VDDVGADGQRDVHAVVDAERNARLAARGQQRARGGGQRAPPRPLGAQLQAARAGREQPARARQQLLAVGEQLGRHVEDGVVAAHHRAGHDIHYSVLPTPFRLQTELKPMGDQPRAIDEIYTAVQRGDPTQVLLGHHGQRQDLHRWRRSSRRFSARRW